MSKPKILKAVRELDKSGFYNKSTHLGDLRNNPNCLNSTTNNGIYTFTGGASSPTDSIGSYDWSLSVKSRHDSTTGDCISSEHIAERLDCREERIVFARSYSKGSWSSFKEDSRHPVVIKEW